MNTPNLLYLFTFLLLQTAEAGSPVSVLDLAPMEESWPIKIIFLLLVVIFTDMLAFCFLKGANGVGSAKAEEKDLSDSQSSDPSSPSMPPLEIDPE